MITRRRSQVKGRMNMDAKAKVASCGNAASAAKKAATTRRRPMCLLPRERSEVRRLLPQARQVKLRDLIHCRPLRLAVREQCRKKR